MHHAWQIHLCRGKTVLYNARVLEETKGNGSGATPQHPGSSSPCFLFGAEEGHWRSLCLVVTADRPPVQLEAPRPSCRPASGLRASLGGGECGRRRQAAPQAQTGFWSLSVSHMVSQVSECYDVHDMRPNWKIIHKKVTHAKLLTVDSTSAIFPFGKCRHLMLFRQ